MRNIIFENNQYYHVYNRGVEKREVFVEESDYIRFLDGMREFNQVELTDGLFKLWRREGEPGSALRDRARLPLVEIISFCLNPNHFHIQLKQVADDGISRFMHKLGTGYTNYFNLKNKRCGPLFQGRFKAKYLSSEESLFWLSVYIHGNPEIHGYTNKAEDYEWSSYRDYLGLRDKELITCNRDIVMKQINKEDYKQSVIEGTKIIIQSRT